MVMRDLRSLRTPGGTCWREDRREGGQKPGGVCGKPAQVGVREGPALGDPGDPEKRTAGGGEERVPKDTRSERRVSNKAMVPEPSVRKHRGTGKWRSAVSLRKGWQLGSRHVG